MAKERLADRKRDGGGNQSDDEGHRADHEGLRGQDPASAGTCGERGADEAPPILGRDEQRRENDRHDEPGERADERVLDGLAESHGRRDVA